MEKKRRTVELTEKTYAKFSEYNTLQIVDTKKQIEEMDTKIEGNLEYLKELRVALREIQDKIKLEEQSLSQNRRGKYSLKKQLSKKNRFARELNRAFSNGKKNIELGKYYTAAEFIKIR